MHLDDITGAIVDESIRIHRARGPGLLESVYEIILASVLERRGMYVERQLPITFSYDGIVFVHAFRADLVVEKRVIVEVKSIERLATVHPKQLLTYLRLTDLRVGLLLNFGASIMKDGIKRVVNDLPPGESRCLRVNQ
ncbi:MAG TPA: GxxExxY protein [Gemmatimonadaceae bacterium]|nr:GxxExxY protein [Gemmatimonadaceae bacterium]